MKNVRDILERIGDKESWVRFETLLVVEASLCFQLLAVVKKQIRFQALYN